MFSLLQKSVTSDRTFKSCAVLFTVFKLSLVIPSYLQKHDQNYMHFIVLVYTDTDFFSELKGPLWSGHQHTNPCDYHALLQ